MFKGEKLVNTKGLKFKIIEHLNKDLCKIKFDITGFENIVHISNTKKKPAEVKDLWHKDVVGIGYVDIKPTKTNQYYSYYYSVWRNILNRCYGLNKKYYDGIKVCDQWHSFLSFHNWCLAKNLTPEYNIDKDIVGLKMYSPDSCIVLYRILNIGLSYNNKKVNPPSLVTKINNNLFRVRVVYLVNKLIDVRVNSELEAYILSTFLKEFYLRTLAWYLKKFAIMDTNEYVKFVEHICISNQYYFKKLPPSNIKEYTYKCEYFKENLSHILNIDHLEMEIKEYVFKHCD